MRAVSIVILLAGCGTVTVVDDTDLVYPAAISDACDPLDPSICALPYPSSHFLVANASSTTGVRLAFDATSLPVNRDGIQTAPDLWNEKDGYSINTPMIAYFPGVSLTGTAPVDDVALSLSADAKTVLINTTTGERVPHWVELDDTAPAPEQRVLLIRPAIPMEWNTRYVVGFRGLVDGEGALVGSSPAFRALRDGAESSDASVVARKSRFENHIFPVLEEEGFARTDLQLAWDFHTTSRENTLGRMEWMREDALVWVEEQGGFDYVITKSEDRDCSVEGERIARDIEGTFTMPLYTLADAPEDPYDTEIQALLTRDANDQPFRNGVTVADFLARIPCSVAEGPEGAGPVAGAAPIMQYGHGLLGGKGEARSGWLAEYADERGFVIWAQDWTGFMEDDVAGITFMLAQNDANRVNPSHFAIVSERSQMGMVEKVLGMRLMSTVLVNDPAFKMGEEGSEVAVVDASKRYYYGNSQGGIMGAAYLAFSPDIDRGILGVPGGPYSLLLPRSKDFDPFFLLFKNKFDDHRDIMLFVAGLSQQLWDPTEPGGWMWDMTRDGDKLPLLQPAIYDNQVTTLGAQIMARAYGAVTVPNPARPIWGVEAKDLSGGYSGAAIAEWKFTDLPEEPLIVAPPGSKDVVEPPFNDERNLDPHECPRRNPQAQEMAWVFLTTGEFVDTCEGPCLDEVATTCP